MVGKEEETREGEERRMVPALFPRQRHSSVKPNSAAAADNILTMDDGQMMDAQCISGGAFTGWHLYSSEATI